MDKKNIKKNLTKAHKAIKPLTDKLSHKDMKHVNDGMQYIGEALKATTDTAEPKAFLDKEQLKENPKSHVWMQTRDGVVNQVTTNDVFNILKDAKKYIKMKF